MLIRELPNSPPLEGPGEAVSKAQDLYRRYVDSVKGRFDQHYLAKCMQAYKYERFTVRHAVSEYHYTLYYYDQAGNLVKTIAPAGVRPNYDSLWLDSVSAARKAGLAKVPAHVMPTQYRYNTLNQVVAQKSPDGGKTDFWYDRLGRLVLSRNARQLAMSSSNNNYLSYTKYDWLGRITEVGQVRDTLNQLINDTFTRNNPGLLSWHTSLLRNREQVTNTVYDAAYDAFTGVATTLVVAQQHVRNRVSYVTYTDTPGITTAFNHASFYSYDIHGNVDTLLQDYGRSDSRPNIMNKNNNRWKKLVYEYDLISGKVNKVKYQPGYTDQFTHRYFYDAENRLIEVETSTDGYTWERDAKYEYYLHGPLARTTIGQQQVQGVDYAYNLQGWLKGMNSTGATATHDIGGDGKAGSIHQYVARDALGFNLNYFHGDYKSINTGVNPFPDYVTRLAALSDTLYRPLYNGNISSMATSIRKFGDAGYLHTYKYDQLNRLTRQDVFKNFDRTNNSYANLTPTIMFGERVSYDANGNILTYRRGSGGEFDNLMDSLSYKYYAGTNRLRQVRDSVPDSRYGANAWDIIQDIDNQPDTSNYVYDAIGNIIQDKQEGITSIKWNVYGKIMEINRNASTRNAYTKMVYTYDAQGNRIGKVTNQGTGKQVYTWYVRDAQGNLMSTYTTEATSPVAEANLGTLFLAQADLQIYGSSRLGMIPPPNAVVDNGGNTSGPYINPDYKGTVYPRGWRQYELTNHLGNVLTVVSDRKFGVYSGGSLTLPNDSVIAAVDYYEPDMLSANDYYPFGMLSRVATGPGGVEKQYKYGFNGKENDYEVKGWQNQQDYGMRIYDPRIGRFLSVDPIAPDYPELTPYQFASNRPIDGIDQDGLEFLDYLIKLGTLMAGKMDDKAGEIRNKPNKTTSEKTMLFMNGLARSTPFGAIHQIKKTATNLAEMKPEQRAQATEAYKKQGTTLFTSIFTDFVQGKAPGTTAVAESVAPTIEKVGQGDTEALAEVIGTTGQIAIPKILNTKASTTIAVPKPQTSTIVSTQTPVVVRTQTPYHFGMEYLNEGRMVDAPLIQDYVGFRRAHILNRHRAGAGQPGKTEFPASWSDEKIINAINKIASDPMAPFGIGKWVSPYKLGTVDGIQIRVDYYPAGHANYADRVSTAYPTNVPANP